MKLRKCFILVEYCKTVSAFHMKTSFKYLYCLIGLNYRDAPETPFDPATGWIKVFINTRLRSDNTVSCWIIVPELMPKC